MRTNAIGEADLHAYADGELDTERTACVQAYLSGHPADAARVESWQRQNAAIRRAFSTPLRDLSRIRPDRRPADDAPMGSDTMARRVGVGWHRRWMIAALATFLGGVCVSALGTLAINRAGDLPAGAPARERPDGGTLPEAHRTRIAWQTFAENADRVSDQTPDASGSLRRAGLATVPDLSGDGMRFLFARPMPGEQSPAVFLLYEAPGRVRVGLVTERTTDVDRAPALLEEGGLSVVLWRSAGQRFALVGQSDALSLGALARRLGDAGSARDPEGRR